MFWNVRNPISLFIECVGAGTTLNIFMLFRYENEITLGEFGACRVDFRHQGNDFFLESARSHLALDRGSGDAGAKRLR